MHNRLSRRQFVKAAVAAGSAVAVPPMFESVLQPARAATRVGGTARSAASGYFFGPEPWATCAALCARIVPTGPDPATDPGATEAAAVVFIDRFLSAFELPSAAADGPAIWVQGRWSGRNPFVGPGGRPSGQFPPDDFLTPEGQGRFLPLTSAQELSWRLQLYGPSALADAPAWAQGWAKQVGSLIPTGTPPAGLRPAYLDGLAAFDAYSQSLWGKPFAAASAQQQDAMLAVAGNLVLDAVPGQIPLPTPPDAPAPARTLFPLVTLHTFQATYGIPEYSWRNQGNDPSVVPLEGTAQWRAIGYAGDTQPLGNSLFDPGMYGPGQGPNAGFGAAPGSADAAAGVPVPFGGYREFRPVSFLDGTGTVLSDPDAALVQRALAAHPEGHG